MKYKIPFIFQTNGTGSDVPFGPRSCGAVEGRTGWGARGQAECAAHVCGVWVRVSKVGLPQAPLCLGSLGPASSHSPLCLPHGAPLQGCPRFLSSTCKLRGFFFFFLTLLPFHHTHTHWVSFLCNFTFLSLALVLMPLSSPQSDSPIAPSSLSLQRQGDYRRWWGPTGPLKPDLEACPPPEPQEPPPACGAGVGGSFLTSACCRGGGISPAGVLGLCFPGLSWLKCVGGVNTPN